MTALMPVSRGGGGLGHRATADADEPQRVLFAQDAGCRGGGELADGVTGDAGDALERSGERVPRQQARGDDERLRDLRVADAVGIPLGAGGDEVDARPLGVLRRADRLRRRASSQGVRKPGDWEPCPGKTAMITVSILPRIGRPVLAITVTRMTECLCASHTASATTVAASRGRRAGGRHPCPIEPRISAVCRISASRGPGRVPADDLGHALEAVADGVRVHEQLAGGRLERAAVVEVAPQRRRRGRRCAPAAGGRCAPRASASRAGSPARARSGSRSSASTGRGAWRHARATAKPPSAARALWLASTSAGTGGPSTRWPAAEAGFEPPRDLGERQIRTALVGAVGRLGAAERRARGGSPARRSARRRRACARCGAAGRRRTAGESCPPAPRPRRGRASRARRSGSAAPRRPRPVRIESTTSASSRASHSPRASAARA